MNHRKRANWLGATFLLSIPIVFCVFILTKTPTVGLIDSGELAAGCYLLNILHPTGYPLWTILGRIATFFPFGTIVNRVSLMSALLSTISFASFIFLLRQQGFSKSISTALGVILSFSLPVWAISTDVEVYSLSLALIIFVWLSISSSNPNTIFLFFPYVSGLTLTNHMFGLSVILGASCALFLKIKKKQAALKQLPLMLIFFALGLSPYLYLILRARCEPVLAWGNPVDLERFFWHVTGKQYRVWMFSSSLSEVLRNTGKGILLLMGSLGYVLLPFAFYGWLQFFKQRKSIAVGLTLSAVVSFFFAVNYSIPDIEAYYIPTILSLLIFAAAGIDTIRRPWRKYRHIVWFIPVGMLIFNFSSQNRSDDWVAYDQAMNTLISADSNATIITDWWDCYAPIFYLQHVEGVREDVCIIDKELVRRSWYLNYLEKRYPWLIERSKPEKERFSEQLKRFEHNQPYDPMAIQESYIALLRSFFLNFPERPSYTTFPLTGDSDAGEILAGFNLVPVGMLIQLRSDTVIPDFDYDRLRIRYPSRKLDQRTKVNLQRYHFFVKGRIEMLKNRGRMKDAVGVEVWYRRNFY
ncbi:MAG: protein O-mannosyl-transferase family [bacterium]